jgi:hypothetical protein
MKTIIRNWLLALVVLSFAAEAAGKKTRYLVSMPHTKEECLAALDRVAADKLLLDKIDWGCTDGDHTGYVVIEAKNADEALAKVPDADRAKAHAVKLVKFSAEEIRNLHK